jgi:hypothetical protein
MVVAGGHVHVVAAMTPAVSVAILVVDMVAATASIRGLTVPAGKMAVVSRSYRSHPDLKRGTTGGALPAAGTQPALGGVQQSRDLIGSCGLCLCARCRDSLPDSFQHRTEVCRDRARYEQQVGIRRRQRLRPAPPAQRRLRRQPHHGPARHRGNENMRPGGGRAQ